MHRRPLARFAPACLVGKYVARGGEHRMTFRSNTWRVAGAGLLVVGSIGACSSAKSSGGLGTGDDGNGESSGGGSGSTSFGSDDGGGGGGGGGSSGSGSGGSFSSSSGSSSSGGPTSADAACASSTQKGEQQGLNAYMMLDYSGSVVAASLTKKTTAINSFVGQPSSGISVGLQYFGLPNTDPDAGSLFGLAIGDSCDPSVYAMPAIEIAPLPGVSSMITSSLASHKMPNTATPTGPALKGAIDHATTWAQAHPSDVTIAILATDGDPSECDDGTGGTLLSQVEAVAAAGVAATPKILTFVIGVGTETANLDGIAQAGGTNKAFIVDTTMNVSAQFLTALNSIRGAALGCQYKIPVPDSGIVDTSRVNVQFTATGGQPELVPQVSSKAQCPASSNAWYYDNPSSPSEILLCSTTCGTVSTGGTVNVLTGCQTVMAPPTK